MKKRVIYLYLFIISFLCVACPYESAIPIDSPKIPIDKNLIGVWKEAGHTDEPNNYDIRKFDDFTYLITENTYRKQDRALEQKKFKGHISVVENSIFLNIKMVKDSFNLTVSDNYFLYKIDIQKDKIKMLPLSQYIREQFTNPADLQAFIKKYQALSFFYAEESEYAKVND
jgi:hypothetical protein